MQYYSECSCYIGSSEKETWNGKTHENKKKQKQTFNTHTYLLFLKKGLENNTAFAVLPYKTNAKIVILSYSKFSKWFCFVMKQAIHYNKHLIAPSTTAVSRSSKIMLVAGGGGPAQHQ